MQIRSIKVSDIARFTALWNRVYSEGEFLISPAPDNATLRRSCNVWKTSPSLSLSRLTAKNLSVVLKSTQLRCAVTKEGNAFASVFLVFTSTKTTEAKDWGGNYWQSRSHVVGNLVTTKSHSTYTQPTHQRLLCMNGLDLNIRGNLGK